MKRILIFITILPILLICMPVALFGIRRYERKLYDNEL
jgi:hypothetical protein